ncbi:exosome component Rrp46 [Suillus subalutaceus]|uniref:exosome component Rrp46 n=1 Tax=Suillus subalutaceus TaxID=48586 RepID=UPI001B87C3DF|nr:exosome component Rrp46 [Suillus subalutaceus]KAG1853481.1 exosome component Rrp46 [Suillus subalutaceus]
MSSTALQSISISCEEGLDGVDGSARFSFCPSCSALASVSGPIAARLAAEHPARATVEVHVRPLSSVPGTAEKSRGMAIREIVERSCLLAQHPRTLIQVVVQALTNPTPGYALLAAEINACTLALINTGSIAMRGVVCAVSVRRVKKGSVVSVEVDIADDAVREGGPIKGSVPPCEDVWSTYSARPGSSFDQAELVRAKEVAREAAAEVWQCMKNNIPHQKMVGETQSPEEVVVKMEI